MNQMMNKFRTLPTWALVLLPAVLFVLAWEPVGIWPLLFVSFIPLFLLGERYSGYFDSKTKFYGFLFLAILGWNISTTWWVWFASAWGAVSMLFLNSLFMLIPFGIWRFIKRRLNDGNKLKSEFFVWGIFIFSWLFYEYGHHRWDLSWPWLALGNGLSTAIPIVQWYEYTGTLGGSFWVLVGNVILYRLLVVYPSPSKINRSSKVLVPLFWILPISFSLILGKLAEINIQQGKKIKVAVLQPSFDPWNEKFNGISIAEAGVMENGRRSRSARSFLDILIDGCTLSDL